MKKFIFPLQFLLDYRERKEKKAKKEFTQAQGEEKREKQILNSLKEEIVFWQEKLRERKGEDIDLPFVILAYSYLDELSLRAERQRARLKEISEKKNRLYGELVKASKEKKVLEKIKERKLKEFLEQVKKIEQGLIDENAIQKFHRKIQNQQF